MRLVPLALLCLALLAATLLAPASPGGKAELVYTVDTGEDLPVVAAWSPEGTRLAYGTEKEVSRRRSPLSVEEGPAIHYPGEVWVSSLAGKPKRILRHNFLRTQEGEFFSFFVERLAWSPDGQKLLVEITDERKNVATFLLTPEGDRVKLGSSGSNVLPGYGAAWLGDSESLGLLSEAAEPRLLHRVSTVRVAAGRDIPLFRERTFSAVAWLPRAHQAVLVERDPEFLRPPRLVVGDLESSELRPLDDLREGYLGGLQASPDETKVSYFVRQNKLAVRGLDPDAPVDYWPIPFGRYEWAGPRPAVLYIEPQQAGGRTGWLTLYDRGSNSTQRVLDELIQDFWVSPDGQRVAVLTVGLKPTLKVYRLEPAASE